jgi:hypothetical protein
MGRRIGARLPSKGAPKKWSEENPQTSGVKSTLAELGIDKHRLADWRRTRDAGEEVVEAAISGRQEHANRCRPRPARSMRSAARWSRWRRRRQKSAGSTTSNAEPKSPKAKLSRSGSRTVNKVGSFAGVSGRTIEKIAKVVEAAEREPDRRGGRRSDPTWDRFLLEQRHRDLLGKAKYVFRILNCLTSGRPIFLRAPVRDRRHRHPGARSRRCSPGVEFERV